MQPEELFLHIKYSGGGGGNCHPLHPKYYAYACITFQWYSVV